MKTKIGIAIILIVILNLVCIPAYASEQEEHQGETELYFDADTVKNRTAAKSALADMHGIFVFRDAFINQESLVKNAEKRNREEIENKVLTSSQPELNYQEWVDLVLEADTSRYIKDVYKEERKSDMLLWIGCISVSICVLCIALRIEDYRKKNQKNNEKKYMCEKLGVFLGISILCTSVLCGCGSQGEDMIQTMQTEGEMREIMELDAGKVLWACFVKHENNQNEVKFYIIQGGEEQGKELEYHNQEEIGVKDVPAYEYKDVNGDEKKDIVLTVETQTDIKLWVFVQDENGDYEPWEEDGGFTPMLQRA